MIEDSVLNGDLVGTKRTPDARDGQVAVARLNDELTIEQPSRTEDAPQPLWITERSPIQSSIAFDRSLATYGPRTSTLWGLD